MTTNLTIAYQGSEGSYSEELLKKEFSEYIFVACKSFTELINIVTVSYTHLTLPTKA